MQEKKRARKEAERVRREAEEAERRRMEEEKREEEDRKRREAEEKRRLVVEHAWHCWMDGLEELWMDCIGKCFVLQLPRHPPVSVQQESLSLAFVSSCNAS